jgi:hypothetical protein
MVAGGLCVYTESVMYTIEFVQRNIVIDEWFGRLATSFTVTVIIV